MTAQTTRTEPGMRADARRNRDQILAAARQLFVERGIDVPMATIAEVASVGVGTVYRRFPDREALITAVARDSFDLAAERLRQARDEEPTAWDALVRILRHAIDIRLIAQLVGGSETVHAIIKADPELERLQRRIYRNLDKVVRAAQDDGTLRQDIGTGDILMMYGSLVALAAEPGNKAVELARERALGIMIDGLRAESSSPLPGAALGPNALLRSKSRARKR